MSAFMTPLEVRLMGRKKWMTLAPLVYYSDAAGTIRVPPEFITDFASVPRLPLAYLLAGDRAPGPAVVHDWLYQRPDFDDRAMADAVFAEAMGCHQPDLGFIAEGLPIRTAMYSAVRWFGGWVWDNTARVAALNPVWSATAWPTDADSPAGGPGEHRVEVA